MASITTTQLASLPTDVLLGHIVPMLANSAETLEQRIDRVAQECTNWSSAHWNERVAALPGFVPMGQVYHGNHVYHTPFPAFCVFGAKEDVPYSIWRRLCDHGGMADYARMMYYRRVQQGQAEWRDQPAAAAQRYGLIAAQAELDNEDGTVRMY